MANDSLLQRLGRKAMDLLSDADAPRRTSALTSAYASNQSEPAPQPPPQSAPAPRANNAESQLRDVIMAQRGQGGGVVNFVSLEKIRGRFGDGWEKVAAKAEDIAKHAIERRLTPADVFTKAGPLNYLVMFSRLNKSQAQLKCALIAEEIAQRLLGADVTDDMIEVKTARIDSRGEIAMETAPRVAELTADLFAANLALSESADSDAQGDSAFEEELDPEEELTADPLARVRMVYQPIWDVRRNALATYICVPAVDGLEGNVQVGETVVPGIENPDVAFDLDMMVLRRVVEDTTNMQRIGKKLLMIAPVHFETLATRNKRRLYMQTAQAIPVAMRNLTIFELVGAPPSTPPSRVLDLVVQLRRFSRAVLQRAPLSQAMFLPPTATGIFGIGVDLSGDKRREKDLMSHLDRFAAAAQKVGLRTYLHGAGSVSLTTLAVGAGFEYIAGDVTASIVEQPSAAYRFDARTVYNNPFTRVAK
jgi:hypothetical protein